MFNDVGQWIKSDFVVKLDEPLKIIGELVGSGNDFNRIQSLLREKEREVDVLRQRILEIERLSLKKTASSTGNENTIAFLKQENERLNREISNLRVSAARGDENTIAFLKQENERLNIQINSLQSNISSSTNSVKGQ